LFNIVRRWLKIRRAEREIASLVARRLCPVKVFSTPGSSLTDRLRASFLIVPETEEQTDALLRDYSTLYSELCRTMARVGYAADAISSIRFQIVSQELIDRDCGGSWREAMEYPIIRTDRTST
jgi:hypothetical protein